MVLHFNRDFMNSSCIYRRFLFEFHKKTKRSCTATSKYNTNSSPYLRITRWARIDCSPEANVKHTSGKKQGLSRIREILSGSEYITFKVNGIEQQIHTCAPETSVRLVGLYKNELAPKLKVSLALLGFTDTAGKYGPSGGNLNLARYRNQNSQIKRKLT